MELCAQRKKKHDYALTMAKKRELIDGGHTEKTLDATGGGKGENKLFEAIYTIHTLELGNFDGGSANTLN